MIPKKFDQIKSADGVAISVDGGEEATDLMRGKGAFKKAFDAAEICVNAGMQTRIHAVINKHSFNDMEFLAKKMPTSWMPLNSLSLKFYWRWYGAETRRKRSFIKNDKRSI